MYVLTYNLKHFQLLRRKGKVCLSSHVMLSTYSIFNVRHTHETAVMEGDVARRGEVV